MSIIGLVILTFSFPYSHLLLYLYGGSTLSEGEGPTLLKAHSIYIIFIAVNGVSECYTFATMTLQQVDRSVEFT